MGEEIVLGILRELREKLKVEGPKNLRFLFMENSEKGWRKVLMGLEEANGRLGFREEASK